MRSNHTACKTLTENLSSLTPADTKPQAQRLKGIQLALSAIIKTVATMEKLLHECVDQKADLHFIAQSIRHEQKWIRKIIKTVRIKRRFLLLGQQLALNMPSSGKLSVPLEPLTLTKIKLNIYNTNLFSLLNVLHEFKQKLYYNAEVVYIALMLYKSDHILYNQNSSTVLQKQRTIQANVLFALLPLARRYCTRLTSALLPAQVKSLYFRLFVIFLQYIERLVNNFLNILPLQKRSDLLSIIDTVWQTDCVQSETRTLIALRNTINHIMSSPRGLPVGARADG